MSRTKPRLVAIATLSAALSVACGAQSRSNSSGAGGGAAGSASNVGGGTDAGPSSTGGATGTPGASGGQTSGGGPSGGSATAGAAAVAGIGGASGSGGTGGNNGGNGGTTGTDVTVPVTPGSVWKDTQGNVIQAHGEGIIKVDAKYYWLGEDKTNGAAFQNVKCYSSSDLAHWAFVNNVLTLQASGDLGPNRVIERPHVIYNASTSQFVMYVSGAQTPFFTSG